MRKTILILEDNSERIAAMDSCLASKFPFFDRQFFRTAPNALAWLKSHLSRAICISLDHDLEPASPGDPDPGTGREVADFLASCRPTCPVTIHSSNALAAMAMEIALADASWPVERVLPYENLDWIAEAWLPLVRRLIVDSAVPAENSASVAAGIR